jgi:hypothetical protein
MNPLLLLFLVAGISAGVAFRQQQSIDRVRAATTRLAGQLLQTRTALESEQTALASARAQLKKVEADLQATRRDRAAQAAAKAAALPTPEQEGWWPENRPYFYLAKTYLPKVRFGDRRIVFDTRTGEEAKGPLPQGQSLWVSDQPFSAEGLSPHLAVLLGMSDEEVGAVNDSYSDFVQGVRQVQAAHVQRVDPPKLDDDDGCTVVARLPDLTTEIQPLTERWEVAIRQTLDAGRAEILLDQAGRCFAQEEMGHLAAEPREFLVNGRNLWVRVPGRFSVHFENPVFFLDLYRSAGQEWEYGHLFGPGAPCELQ